MKPQVHLLANAHLDPFWLWEWPEGLAQALALARSAVGLCEELEGFVFNRGEAQFYEWVEEYDPPLFARIRAQVAAGRWHIMGGWFVQCDCNMPAGESIARQIERGRAYFADRFGVRPTTAVNLDPFGHSRGLVQLLVRAGYDAYLFCRPGREAGGFPAPEFRWIGYDGSAVTALLAEPHYNSAPGGAAAKVEEWLEGRGEGDLHLIPWGVGDHGGGPSRDDFRALEALAAGRPGLDFIHSTPERWAGAVRERQPDLPAWKGDLNPFAVGCYTSQVRVKQAHRRLENRLFRAEKTAAAAWLAGRLPWPAESFERAERDLLLSQFHDGLPGSSVPSVEEHLLRRLGRGLEILAEIEVKALHALAREEAPPAPGESTLFVYNPHPHPVETLLEWELQREWPNEEGPPLGAEVRGAAGVLPVQLEKAEMNIAEDNRKRLVFPARLPPGRLSRFDARLGPGLGGKGEKAAGGEGPLPAAVDPATGRLARWTCGGTELLAPGGCRFAVMADDEDPWGMRVTGFRERVGEFALVDPARAAAIAGVGIPELAPVRVVERGPVRTVVEAILAHGESTLVVHYKLPRAGGRLELDLLVHWREKSRMLKLLLPAAFAPERFLGQTVFGMQDFPRDGREVCARQWTALVGAEGPVLACINEGIYGFSCSGGEMALSLLRSPVHAGHPTLPGRPIAPRDRHTRRIDQGERRFRLWLEGDPGAGLLGRIDVLAQGLNERPPAVPLHPAGPGGRRDFGLRFRGGTIRLAACRRESGGGGLRLRLFEPTGRAQQVELSLPGEEGSIPLAFGPFEVKELRYDRRRRAFTPPPA